MNAARAFRVAFLAVVLVARAAGAATPASAVSPAQGPTEAGVRAMLGLPADAPLRYLADDRTPLTLAEFSAHVPAANFDAHTDANTRVTTLQFMEIGGIREIGPGTRLPPLDATARVSGFPTWLLLKNSRVIGRGTGLGDDAMRDPAIALAELERWIAARRDRQPRPPRSRRSRIISG